MAQAAPATPALSKGRAKTKKAARPAAKPTHKAVNLPALSPLQDEAQANHNARLRGAFMNFLEGAQPEERQFLIEVLEDWNSDGRSGRRANPKGAIVPLFDAIQQQLDGECLMKIPRQLRHQVNDLVIEQRRKASLSGTTEAWTGDQVRDHWNTELRTSLDYFMAKANADEKRFLRMMLMEWEWSLERETTSALGLPIAVAASLMLETDPGKSDLRAENRDSTDQFLRLLTSKTWLSTFLKWITDTDENPTPETLTPSQVTAWLNGVVSDFQKRRTAILETMRTFPALLPAMEPQKDRNA